MIKNNSTPQKIVVVTMYKFVHLADYRTMCAPLLDYAEKQGIKGTILLAEEGINSTVAGKKTSIENFLDFLKSDPRLSDLKYKVSFVMNMPFYRMKVRIKKEIVSFGIPDIDPVKLTGIRIPPKDWNRLISDTDVLVLDTRNQYEFVIGSFRNSISPQIDTFRDFSDYASKNLDSDKQKKIAMYCTGGIRCEKASSYLLSQGFDKVYQLDGGILRYLEEITPEESLWKGECFVFDGRVSVNEHLEKGEYEQCYACRRPVSCYDKKSEKYEEGISCPYCFDQISADKRKRLFERQYQMSLARERNQQHIGTQLRRKQYVNKRT